MSKPIWIICTEDARDGLVQALLDSSTCPFDDRACTTTSKCRDCIDKYIDFEIVKNTDRPEKKPTKNETEFQEWAGGLSCGDCPVPRSYCNNLSDKCGNIILKWLAEDDDNG